MPVLGFKPPSKSLVYTKARQQLPRPLGTFVVGGVLEPQAEVSRVHQAQTDEDLDMWREEFAQEWWRHVGNMALARCKLSKVGPP